MLANKRGKYHAVRTVLKSNREKKNETYVKIDIPPNLTAHSPELVQALQIDNTK